MEDEKRASNLLQKSTMRMERAASAKH